MNPSRASPSTTANNAQHFHHNLDYNQRQYQRPTRTRPKHKQRTKQTTDTPSIAAQKFLDYLSSPSCPLPHSLTHPFNSTLTHLLLTPTPHAQLTVASQLSTIIISHMINNNDSAYALLRYRLAHLTESLIHFLHTQHEQALSLLSTLLQSIPSSSQYHYQQQQREALTLCAVLRAIVSCVSSTITNVERQAVERHVPTMVPLLHAVLFLSPCVTLPSSSFSPPPPSFDYSSNPSDHLHQNRNHSLGRNNHIQLSHQQNQQQLSDASTTTVSNTVRSTPSASPTRRLSLIALQSLSTAAPTSLLPFWPMLLPTRAGISRLTRPQRQTIASLLLYDDDIEIRSAATSLASSLVSSSARSLLRHHHHSHNQSSPSTSFTPVSERVLTSCVSLASVTASALKGEHAHSVLPKLARLAGDIVITVPVDAMPRLALTGLVAALTNATINGKDRTVRAAAAKSLAKAVGGMGARDVGGVMEDVGEGWRCQLSGVCDDVVHSLVAVNVEGEVVDADDKAATPTEELLGVLKAIFAVDVTLFHRTWKKLQEFFSTAMTAGVIECPRQSEGNIHEGVIEDEVSKKLEFRITLHVVRVIETYLSHLSPTDEEDTTIICTLYRRLLRHAIKHPFHAVRVAGIVALDALLRTLPLSDDSREDGMDFVCSSAESVGMTMTTRDVMLECVHDLCAIISSSSYDDESISVKAAAVKALGALRVGSAEEGTVVQTLRVLLDVAKSESNKEILIVGRALSSCVTIVDGVLMEQRDENGKEGVLIVGNGVWEVVIEAAQLASKLLMGNGLSQCEGGGLKLLKLQKSATERGQMELCSSAAVQTVAMFLCVTRVFGVDENERSVVVEKGMTGEMVDVLCSVVQNENESINMRCGCCKAIGRVLKMMVTENENANTNANENRKMVSFVVRQIGRLESGRLEGAAAKALTEVLNMKLKLVPKLNILKRCGDSLKWGMRQVRVLDISSKDRGQFLFLQKCMNELLCTILASEGEIETEMVDEEGMAMLVGGVCGYHDMSKYLMDVVMKARCRDDVVSLLEKEKLLMVVVPARVGVLLDRLFDVVHLKSNNAKDEART